MTVAMAVALVGLLVALVGSLMLIVAAFRTSAGWGLATLLVPGAFLVFVFAHWREARAGFFTLLMAAALILGSGVAGGLGVQPAPSADSGGEPAASAAAPQVAAPVPAPEPPQSSAAPSPAVRWTGQARDAARAQQQRDSAAGLP
jgi:hypothetical protein